MPWSRSPLPFVIAAAVLAAPPAAWADAPVPSGSVVAVIQQANAVGSPTGKRMLDVAAPVYIGDQIQTGEIGEAQLRFRDSTKLVVGPNSNLVIDDFVYKNRGTAEDVSINAVRGTFRFITGSSPKNAYSLKTPVATIGVRGTEFDFSVGRNGETTLVLYEGSASLCDNSGQCVTMTGGCGIAVVPPGGGARRVTTRSERNRLLESGFPYLKNQGGLQRAFRTDSSSCQPQKKAIFIPDGARTGSSGGSNTFGERRSEATPPAPAPTPTPDPGPGPSPDPGPSCGGGSPGEGGHSGGHHEGGGWGGGPHGGGNTPSTDGPRQNSNPG